MEYQNDGTFWCVRISHQEMTDDNLRNAQFALLFVPGPISTTINTAIGYWRVIDWLGGSQGVEVTGEVATGLMTSLPLPWGIFNRVTAFAARNVGLLAALALGNPLLAILSQILP